MDNVTNIEPADNEERLLKGILEGDTETNIEPAGNKERLLKGILEKLGGGSGLPSVDDDDNDKVLGVVNGAWGKTYPIPTYEATDEHSGSYDAIDELVMGHPFIVACFGDKCLVIPNYLSSAYDNRWQATVLYKGNIMSCFTMSGRKGADQQYTRFYKDFERTQSFDFDSLGTMAASASIYATNDFAGNTFNDNNVGVALKYNNTNAIRWAKIENLMNIDAFATAALVDFTTVAQSFAQILTMLKAAASANAGTMVAKYLPLTPEQQTMLTVDITQVYTWASQNKSVVCKMDNEMLVVTNSTADFFSAKYQEIDSSNDKLYDIEMIISTAKVYFKCICHEATSLM